MILELIFSIILDLLEGLLNTFNLSGFTLPSWSVNATNLLLKGLSFFPFEIWSILFANVLFWVGVHFAWAVVEWIYIKLPGVN